MQNQFDQDIVTQLACSYKLVQGYPSFKSASGMA